MIFGIGTDIVRVARMDEALARHGREFARRILTEGEYREFCLASRPAHFLAKRFAAKEATAKAMGTGFRDGLSLRHIGVAHDGKGRPSLIYHDRAEQLRRELGIGEGHLSLADERDYALAFVTLLNAVELRRL